ncbi:SLIT-ROBO Rho GTPase-activating protein 3-like isoform X14 [Phycodurus eques]|uniref:SLIT-ROBO Rho GTPase-activating protein 3-like isoform X14 n=1 Tax=Phycodurus eques TaxID=693459 RepID=UPI002ACE3B02|nr:SLIT-ROBO Rho GTPase-activating protein 3-like isoform X14 [Phycodurus eques]
MASHVKFRKDKVGVLDYDTQIKEVRCQLVEQLKVMDVQLEQKSQHLHDFADYLRRRSEIESEYSRSLEKLAERFTNRIKRKEASGHSVAQMWLALLSHTRRESKDHNQLSDDCSAFLIRPLYRCLEYTQRLAKKSKDICTQLQDGLLKVTAALQTAWRTYSHYHADYLCADSKLKEAEKQEEKQKQHGKKMERLIEKANRSMSAALSSFLETLADVDSEPNDSQEDGAETPLTRPNVARRRANQQEMENLYLTRVKEFLVGTSLESKLQAKHDLLKVAVEKGQASNRNLPSRNGKSARVPKTPSSGEGLLHNPKLFNGDMLSFMQASGRQIPVVVESCIRFINLNGLHHEGIFRVSGSQVEVNKLRDAFERGGDPLAEHESDLDSVAGVLKMYFRDLKNPLLPAESLSRLLEYAHDKKDGERADQLKSVIRSFPEPLIVVMRYLFAFLHHVSQYSDENMMQPYNLAVCFGPSLVRGSGDERRDGRDPVALQPQINALVESLIVRHESVFPGQSELRGPVYEKCMTAEQDDREPNAEEGDGEADVCKVAEVEAGHAVNRSNSATGALQKPSEVSKAAKSGPADHRRTASGPAGGGVLSGGAKAALQIPTGPRGRLRRIHSPGFARRECTSPLRMSSRSTRQLNLQVDIFGVREETGVPGEKPRRQGPNLKPIRDAAKDGETSETKLGGNAARPDQQPPDYISSSSIFFLPPPPFVED